MIKLLDLLKEANLPEDSNLLKMINRDKPKIKAPYKYLKTIFDNFTFPVTPAYDFGGIENPLEGNNITVVDIEPNEYGEFEEDNYIQADLSKYIELPPRKGIFMGHSLIYIENYPTIAKTIDAALQPGGLLIISDWLDPINDIIPYLQSYKLLEVFTSDADLEDMSVSVTLKK